MDLDKAGALDFTCDNLLTPSKGEKSTAESTEDSSEEIPSPQVPSPQVPSPQVPSSRIDTRKPIFRTRQTHSVQPSEAPSVAPYHSRMSDNMTNIVEDDYDCKFHGFRCFASHTPVTVVVEITDPELPYSPLLPGLQAIRVLDDHDENGRLWHSYMFVFTGEAEAMLESGWLKCSVLSPTRVAITMPFITAGFIKRFQKVRDKLIEKNKATPSTERALTTAANSFVETPGMALCNVLIKINTGEELTNATWMGTSNPLGRVKPQSVLVDDEFEFANAKYPTTQGFTGFKIARVERSHCYGKPNRPGGNVYEVADDLAADLQGMEMND